MLKTACFWLIMALLPTPVLAERSLVFAVINDVPSTPMAVAILERAYERIGVSMTTLYVPSSRAMMMANTGATDGDLFRIADVADELTNLIQVPYPLLHGEVKVATLNPSLTTWDPHALKNMRVGVRRGVIVAERAAAGTRRVKVDTYTQLLRLLQHGRIDLALVSDIEGTSPLQIPAWRQVRVLDEPVRSFTLHHYLAREHAALARPLAEALTLMDASGETAVLIAKHRETFYAR